MKGIIAWFAHNHVAANLLMFLMVAGGLAALPSIQQKSFPDIDFDIINISVPYLGAAPEEVEEGVCVRIEEEIHGINGIERITSTAAEGACNVAAELIAGYDIDRALSEIKNAVDAIDTFPVEAEKPVVNHFAIRRNAIQLALSGDVDERALKVYGTRIRDEIAALPGVTQVDISNARNYEISIEVSEESLRRHRLSFDQVVAAVRRSSLDLPGGSIKTRRGEILLRTKGQAYTGADFEQLVVLTRADGTRLLIRDVANVVDGFEEDPLFARFDGEPAVLIQVYRVGDQKVLDVVETVKGYVAQARAELPAGLDLTIWRDGSQSLRDRLAILERAGISGFILVFVLLSLFLRLRLAIWVSIGVPLSFLGALALFPSLEISIDVISLFAFILVLGLLVDDAIVVGENVHSHQERAEDPLQSAIVGTQEVSVPVIFGVLTTVAAFLPLIVAPGAMGQVFSSIGVVVVCCLFFSLAESQLVLPSHLGHVRTRPHAEPVPGSIGARWKRLQARMSGSLAWLAENGYRPLLERALEWRYATIAICFVLLLWTIAVVRAGVIPFSFFPPVEGDYISATVTMPQGTPVEVTAAAVDALEASARRIRDELDAEFGSDDPLVVHIFASVGEQPSRRGNSGGDYSWRRSSGQSHVGEVTLELQSADHRPLRASEVEQRWREATPVIPGAEEVSFTSSIFTVGEPINLRLQSADVLELQRAADELENRLAEYPGVIDIADSFRAGKEEIKLAILPSAEVLGLTLDDLARQVRQAFYGAEAQRIQRDREDIRVMVRYPRAERRSLDDLANMRIRTPDGSEVPFYTVARAELGRGYATITRSDRQRVINVTADIDPARANANEVLADVRARVLPQMLVDHPSLHVDLEGEQREQRKVARGLLIGYGLALILIYALLAIPLRSYLQPLIIMVVIPFGLVGAVAGHLIQREPTLSMMSVFGFVALSGVVVNASLVLVHYVNNHREAGESARDAVRAAGVMRFRPILLTSLSTFVGLTPLLSERSVSAAFLIPMAISLAYGVAFATVITLLLVPCLYLVLDDAGVWLRRRRGADGAAGPAELHPLPGRAGSDGVSNSGSMA